MRKISKFFEWAYLVVGVFFIVEAIREWNTEGGRSYLFLFLAVVAIFMFYFRRHFRHKYGNRKK